ncbi:hypothetical protein EBB07_00785 [Paenibacillaceae bacterium]|nr:hypothetical protein EBB07_00785 [Paenibacillaceae bacterium]
MAGKESAANEQPIKTKKEPKVSKEQLIYVGPNLRGGRLLRFTVFREGVPDYLSELVKQPEVSRLLVPVSALSETLQRVDTAGTLEHKAFEALKHRKDEA